MVTTGQCHSAFLFLAMISFGTFCFAAERDVQFTSVDFTIDVIELHNFGDTDQPMDDWRFCSHSDDDGERLYTAPNGLDGVTIEAGTSLRLWLNNDGPNTSDDLNISDLGGVFASTLDQDAYSINLYWPNGGSLGFGIADDMVDHIQWNIDGVDNSEADQRGGVAQMAGLWTDQNLWVSTTADTLRIELTDLTGGLLHSPANYAVIEPSPADFNSDGSVDGDDLSEWEAAYNVNADADANEDGVTDGQDFLIWQQEVGVSGLSSASAVPEPGGLWLALGAALLMINRPRSQ